MGVEGEGEGEGELSRVPKVEVFLQRQLEACTILRTLAADQSTFSTPHLRPCLRENSIGSTGWPRD